MDGHWQISHILKDIEIPKNPKPNQNQTTHIHFIFDAMQFDEAENHKIKIHSEYTHNYDNLKAK